MPPDATRDLTDAIARATSDPNDPGDVRIHLAVSGGVAAERYDFTFEASAGGRMTAALADEIRARRAGPVEDALAADELAELLGSVDAAALAGAARQPPNIPPDSLVGRLTVASGQDRLEVRYMADPGQAETAGATPPPAVSRVLDAVHRIAARRLDADPRP